MTAETSSTYSRENITNKENKEKAVQEMRAEKGHVKADQAKTPEQKKELSEKWLKRAGMTDGGGKAEIMKLLGDPKTAAEFVAAVEKKQEEYGLKKDGILGWATLEKMDNEITNGQDEYYVNKPDESGLERSEARAAKTAAEEAEAGEKKQQLAELKRKAESTDTAEHEGDIRDPEGKSLAYDTEKKQWVGNESDTQGKVFNTETGEYESGKSIVKINDLVLKENDWVHDNGTQYFRNGESVVRFIDGKYAIAPIKDGKVGEFTATEYSKLPKDFLTKNAQYVAKEVENKYGSLVDWEFGTNDLAVKDMPIKDLIRGTENDGQLTPEANARIQFLIEKFQPLVEKHPEMKKLTLGEYNQFSKNPDSIATSRLTKYPGIVYAEDYGIDNGGYGYDKNDGVIIKRPRSKKEENNPDKVFVMMDGKFVTARDFIVSANTVATNGTDKKLPGTEIVYKKDSRGNIELGDMKYMASQDKWEKTGSMPI